MRPLNFALWSDNVLVMTLSNFHGPEILDAGMGVIQKQKDIDDKWERTRTELLCPVQTKEYCEMFYLINKGNGAEANYDLGGRVACTIGRQS